MKRQRIICTALSAVLGFSLFALGGCGNDGGDDTVRINVKTPLIRMSTPSAISNAEIATSGDFLSLAAKAFTEQYKKDKVEITVNMFPDGEEERFVTDIFGTEDAADVLYDDFYNMITYVHSGNAISLEGLLSESARADLKDGYVEWGEVAGEVYMLPYLGRQNILMYNKAILREYGLDEFVEDETGIIQTWSIDEWEYVLDTLGAGMAQKTDKKYAPTMMYAKDNQGDSHIMALISGFGVSLVDDDGYFHFDEPEALRGLEWLQSGIERNWYMPHPQNFTLSDCDRLFHEGQIAFYVFNIGCEVYLQGEEEVAKCGYVNFPSLTGGIATRFVTGFEIFDNKDARKLAAAKDFVKFIYETEEWLNVSSGSISASKRVTEQQEAQNMLMIDQFTKNIPNVIHFMRGNPNWQGLDYSVRNVFYKGIFNLLSGRLTPQECAAKLNKDCNEATEYGRENSVIFKKLAKRNKQG